MNRVGSAQEAAKQARVLLVELEDAVVMFNEAIRTGRARDDGARRNSSRSRSGDRTAERHMRVVADELLVSRKSVETLSNVERLRFQMPKPLSSAHRGW